MKRERRGSALQQEPELLLAVAEARIAWVLDHPQMSDWLKHALRAAEGLDPIALQNDVEMLRHLLGSRSQAQIEITMVKTCVA